MKIHLICKDQVLNPKNYEYLHTTLQFYRHNPHKLPTSYMIVQDTRYIFVTGGVMSGLGKGVISSSIAKIKNGFSYDEHVYELSDFFLTYVYPS